MSSLDCSWLLKHADALAPHRGMKINRCRPTGHLANVHRNARDMPAVTAQDDSINPKVKFVVDDI
jgi:hypothetical protein